VPSRSRLSLEAFWERAAISKLEAKFAVAREMEAIPHLALHQLRAIVFQYRYFTQAFVTDLAVLVARCPEGRLRSLLGQLLNEELGQGNPEAAHLQLYDRFLHSIGAIADDARPAELRDQIHPRVRTLLDELRDRTASRPLLYAIGMRVVIEHESKIDWTFWDIHTGHADLEHNELVRSAVKEFVRRDDGSQDVADDRWLCRAHTAGVVRNSSPVPRRRFTPRRSSSSRTGSGSRCSTATD
jgi:hypothetical protein